MADQFIIVGNVLPADGAERVNVRVQAFDRDLPSIEQREGSALKLLGEAAGDDEGQFRIAYSLDQFSKGESVRRRRSSAPNPDVSFKVFDKGGQELAIRHIEALNRQYRGDEIIFNAPAQLDVRIFVHARRPEGASEYEELIDQIAPVTVELSLSELTDEDILFLIHELDLEEEREPRRRIEWLRMSTLMAVETRLRAAAFYAWARTGLPDLWNDLGRIEEEVGRSEAMAKLLNRLAATEAQALIASLRRAVEERIVPAAIGDQAQAIANAIRRRLQKEHIVRFRLEHATSGESLSGYTVTTFEVNANQTDLGTDVTDLLGEFEVVYFAGEGEGERTLSFRIRSSGIDGAIEETTAVRNDATSITLRISLPSDQPSLRQLGADERLNVPEALIDTLEESHQIRSLADIRRVGGLNRIPTLRALDSPSVRRLDAIADLERLSADVSEISLLVERNYESVAAIAEAPHSEFIAAISKPGSNVSERRATELHIAAKAQTEMLEQIFAGIAIEVANGNRPSGGFVSGDYIPPFPENQDNG